jgi:hypothetical protein
MKGKVNDGDLVTLAPVDLATIKQGDIVLVRVHGTDYLHLVTAIDGERYQIGNNRGGINGWVRGGSIYGTAVQVEPYSPERKRQGVQHTDQVPDGSDLPAPKKRRK